MAWFWNKEKKQKQEISSVRKMGNLPIYEVTFGNPCSHCGRKEVKHFNLKMSKDPMEHKAIGNYIAEEYDKVLNQSLNFQCIFDYYCHLLQIILLIILLLNNLHLLLYISNYVFQ